jgi:hypothetical protein
MEYTELLINWFERFSRKGAKADAKAQRRVNHPLRLAELFAPLRETMLTLFVRPRPRVPTCL